MNAMFWLKRPQLIPARLKYWMWERSNPDKPWLCPGTIALCEKHLNGSIRAIEFGSGRSTHWFAKRVSHLTSVEHHPQWHAKVLGQLQEAGVTNVEYLLIPLSHPETEPERSSYSPVPDYVAVVDRMPDASLHFALVDGHYRTTCVRHLIPKMAVGGYLLVDDIKLWKDPAEIGVPSNWEVVDDSTNGIKRGIIWQVK